MAVSASKPNQMGMLIVTQQTLSVHKWPNKISGVLDTDDDGLIQDVDFEPVGEWRRRRGNLMSVGEGIQCRAKDKYVIPSSMHVSCI